MSQQTKPVVAEKTPSWWDPSGTITLVASINYQAQHLKIVVGDFTDVYIDPLEEDVGPLWQVSWNGSTDPKRCGSTKLTVTEIIAAFGLPQQYRREGPNDKIYIELERGIQALIAPGKFARSGRYLNMPGKEDSISNLSLLVTDDVKEAIKDILRLT